MGVSQVQLRVSRYTVQLSICGHSHSFASFCVQPRLERLRLGMSDMKEQL